MRTANMTKADGETKHQHAPVPVELAEEHEPQKTAPNILKQEIKQGIEESRRSAGGLLVSGISAGLDLGFSVVAIAIVLTLDKGTLLPVAREILVAAAYTIGFILVILGHSELFTEHTTLAVFPVLNGDTSLGELLRLWLIVYVANLVGAAAIALAIAYVGPGLGIIEAPVLGDMARQVVLHPWQMILASGVLAGWLMGLVSWLVTAARETVSQILIIVLVTGIIGLAHLHHAIAGTTEVLSGLFAGQGIAWGDFGYFLLWATLGNILGGGLLVALIKYGHVSQSGTPPEPVELKQ
jgi:formate-nitrite transporter family protein